MHTFVIGIIFLGLIFIIPAYAEYSITLVPRSESNGGIFIDPSTGVTIVDLGTVFTIAGNGPIPDMMKWDNELITKEMISPVSVNGDWEYLYHFVATSPGVSKIDLISDGKITHSFTFRLKQVEKEQVPSSEEFHQKENNERTDYYKSSSIPSWIISVNQMHQNQMISNDEYVEFVKYVIDNKLVSESRILHDQFYTKIILYENKSEHVSNELVFYAINKWDVLNKKLVFLKNTYDLPSNVVIVDIVCNAAYDVKYLSVMLEVCVPSTNSYGGEFLTNGFAYEEIVAISPDLDRFQVQNTLMHEIGHVLGLGHNVFDYLHLMAPYDLTYVDEEFKSGLYKNQTKYDDIGYNIPVPLAYD